MKTLMIALALFTTAARAETPFPTCHLEPVKEELSLAHNNLLINDIKIEDDMSLRTSELVDLMAKFERHGLCKAVYPAGY
jgi:hypothetical protein